MPYVCCSVQYFNGHSAVLQAISKIPSYIVTVSVCLCTAEKLR